MVGGIDLYTLLAQLPHLSKVVTAEHVHPELQKTVLAHESFESQLRRRSQVSKTEKKEAAQEVREDKPDTPRHAVARSRKPKAPEEEESTASNASPWAGNILNVKI